MTPEKAIKRGFWVVKLPSLFIMLGSLCGYITMSELEYIPPDGKWFLCSFMFAIVGSWLIWSVQIPKWRLWAYQRVDDLDELKRLGVEEDLIWPEGHFFERTEIASKKVREELQRLEKEKRKHRG